MRINHCITCGDETYADGTPTVHGEELERGPCALRQEVRNEQERELRRRFLEQRELRELVNPTPFNV